MIKDMLGAKERFILFLCVIGFVVLHVYGLHIPYHQDEYKWILYSHPELIAPGSVPHPPLTEFIYTRLGPLVGDNNFRTIPFVFGFVDLFLVFYLAKNIFDKRTAMWATFLFVVSFYSLLASLMVDVDGAIMPFFLLLLCIGYYAWKEKNYAVSVEQWPWIVLLVVGAIGGFLIKVITALPILALGIDYVLEKNIISDKKKLFKAVGYLCAGGVGLVLILVLSKFIFPFFNLEYSFKYWEHFVNFGNRGWFQTFIQFVKSILFCSPLLVLPMFLLTKDIVKKVRPFIIFIILELITYLLVFDFSVGALDRYFQFLIVPLCIISAVIFARHSTGDEAAKTKFISYLWVIVCGACIFLVQFLPQNVPSLYPKSAWVSRVISFKWNFLYVFSGGSGPFPFYVSFAFIALSWIACFVLILLALRMKHFKKTALFGILLIGIMYNGVFTEEYLFGKINGSGSRLLASVVSFIKNNAEIKKVVVYNDNGGFEIQQLGKYEKRLYTSPEFDIHQKIEGLNTYKDFYLELNIPRIDPQSVYRKYLDSCGITYTDTDKYISATVYDCRKAPKVTLAN